jgi:hypothetical protein
VIYEPAVKNMNENLTVFKYDYYGDLEKAENKAQELKRKLQDDSFYSTPMLEVHPKANSYEYFSNLITSPYVIEKVLPYQTYSNTYKDCNCYPGCSCYYCDCEKTDTVHTRVNDPEKYLKPLDIIKVNEGGYNHVGVYLGKIDGEYKVCHFSKKYNGTRVHSLNSFLRDYHKGNGKITRYHPMIPFKYSRRIAEQIAWAIDTNFRENNYSLTDRNCEHSANMIVYGINYSEQIYDSVLSGNNGKGSTIKLTNEMIESNGKLGERNNTLAREIKANIEVPPKEPCRIM